MKVIVLDALPQPGRHRVGGGTVGRGFHGVIANAPVDEAGLTGGLQGMAAQLGGVMGSSILRSILAARFRGLLPGELASHGLPPAVAAGVTLHKTLVDQGWLRRPVGRPGMPVVADVTHQAFLSGLRLAMIVGAAATLLGTTCGPHMRRALHPVEGSAPLPF
jgi:hypothetical protein